ncbi:MAG: ribosomal subunit interface protein [Spirochaetes bacterium RBG_13_68_11]|nr:MAG: ribosomal subunit interface protein [Spirochaetes bacterium RBG_13_68_11]
MNTELKGVHLEISQRTRDYVEKKLPRISFAEDLVTDLLLAFSREKSLYNLDATVNFRWGSSTHIHVENFKLTEGIDALFDKLEPKIEKEKNKLKDHHKNAPAALPEE